jgi:molybdenum cofactor synthesis domain-containing protein
MKTIAVQDAVGTVLAHDVTRIVPGQSKGPAFRKGHIVRAEDLPVLLDIGKEHLYVLELKAGMVHENDAARRIAAAAAGPGLKLTDPSEGRINLVAEYTGLLKINVDGLNKLNAVDDVVFATIHGNHRIEAGQAVGGTRIIPLITNETIVRQAEKIAAQSDPLISIKPFQDFKVGLITTGSEIYNGRIKDTFGPVVKRKFKELGSEVISQILVSDEIDMTLAAIAQCREMGVDMIALTGGMSVDPDDQTPAAIRAAGARVISYGAPTFPGAMFMLAYLDDMPIVGLPGCVMYHKSSIFELIVPRILAGDEIMASDIAKLGYGGYCAGCPECRYPACGFGKV